MMYADTSALVKLVVPEDESAALTKWLRSLPACASSDLARTELMRAIRRSSSVDADAPSRARSVLDSLLLIAASAAVFDTAGRLEPTELCSLDAIHLASALGLGDELEGIVTYDGRMAQAAQTLGIPVHAPS